MADFDAGVAGPLPSIAGGTFDIVGGFFAFGTRGWCVGIIAGQIVVPLLMNDGTRFGRDDDETDFIPIRARVTVERTSSPWRKGSRAKTDHSMGSVALAGDCSRTTPAEVAAPYS